jgi:hypothetical protein
MAKLLFSFIVCAVVFQNSMVVSAQDRVSAPVFREGDTWLYKISSTGGNTTSLGDGNYELTFTQGNVKLFKVEGDQKAELAASDDGSNTLLDLVGKRPDTPLLKFPFSTGDKWNYEYRQRPVGARRDITILVEIIAEGSEQVSTPAGTFKAHKLTRSLSSVARGGGGGRRQKTIAFFSPESRSIIKRSIENENTGGSVQTELVKFTPGN